MTFKVVYNCTYGGFGLSAAAEKALAAEGHDVWWNLKRYDPGLVGVVERLGHASNDRLSRLKIKEVPLKFKDCWELGDDDGRECVCVLMDKYRVMHARAVLGMDSETAEQRLAAIAAVMDEPDHEDPPKEGLGAVAAAMDEPDYENPK